MIEIKKMSMDCKDAKDLVQELNEILTEITGFDGTAHFKKEDTEQGRSVFLIGYLDGVPFGCGAIRELDQEVGEIKRVYARRNQCGMGTRILKALEVEAKIFGYRSVYLETRVQNEHAINFYEKNGYNHCENYGAYHGNKDAYCFMKMIR